MTINRKVELSLPTDANELAQFLEEVARMSDHDGNQGIGLTVDSVGVPHLLTASKMVAQQ